MRAYFDGITTKYGIRQQPWTVAKWDPESKYYDFRKQPAAITEVLEDFKPLENYESVQLFYELLKWINGEDSPFESTDCRFRPPSENTQRDLADKSLVREGGLVFFFRDLITNLSEDSEYWQNKFDRYEINSEDIRLTPNQNVTRFIERAIPELTTDFEYDCIGIALLPVSYTEAPIDNSKRLGYQIVFRFWIWGNSDDEILTNFKHTVQLIINCLKVIAKENLTGA